MRHAGWPCRAALVASLMVALPASACSRTMILAASPIGRSMMISRTGEVTGVVRDVLDLVSLRSGCKIEYIVVPRARGHYLFQSGAIDLMAAVTRTPDRDEAGQFVQTHQVQAMLVSMRERPLGQMTIAGVIASKLTIDTIRGYSFGPAYDKLLKQPALQAHFDSSPEPETVLRKLLAGRTAAALLFPATLIDAAQQAGLSERLRVDELAGMEAIPAGFYLNNRMPPADRERIRQAIQSLVQEGQFEKIFRSYNLKPEWALAGSTFLTGNATGKRK